MWQQFRHATGTITVFPAGVTHINSEVAFEERDGKVYYFNGHLPEVGREVGILSNTLHKAIRAGRLRPGKKRFIQRCDSEHEERAQYSRHSSPVGSSNDAQPGTGGGQRRPAQWGSH